MRISDWSSDVCSSDLGAGLADRLDVQAVELETRAVALHARQSRVDDIVDARHRQRGLGDVGRQHDAPLRTRVEHPVLVARGQPRVQRQDLGVAVLAVFQRLMRIADLALRSEEHTSELQSLMRISYAVFCLKK